MFNNVNNPFGNRAISSSTSSDSNGRRQKEDPKEELKKHIAEYPTAVPISNILLTLFDSRVLEITSNVSSIIIGI